MSDMLVISDGAVGSRMAAPGIRAYNIARLLSQQIPGAGVTLALPPRYQSDIDGAAQPFSVIRPAAGELARLAHRSDVVIAGRLPASLLPSTYTTRVVFDMYSPLMTEWANVSRWFGKRHRRAWLETRRKHLMLELTAADLVLCANERQRNYVAGIMSTLGMITAAQYDRDPSLSSRFAVAPLGIRPHEPALDRASARRGLHAGIGDDDIMLLWNGTIVEWYDVATLLHAMRNVCDARSDVKLVFLGTDYPQPHGEDASSGLGSGAVQEAIALAARLDLLDRHVFFNQGWADDALTERYLAAADVGVSTYFDTLETHYSFRVRYLDLFWASLPIICTRGDEVSELVEARGLGAVVPEKDAAALSEAILRLADPAERARCRAHLAGIREDFRWESTLRPLIEFCRDGSFAAGEKWSRALPMAWRAFDWAASEALEKARFAYPKKLARRGHSGLG